MEIEKDDSNGVFSGLEIVYDEITKRQMDEIDRQQRERDAKYDEYEDNEEKLNKQVQYFIPSRISYGILYITDDFPTILNLNGSQYPFVHRIYYSDNLVLRYFLDSPINNFNYLIDFKYVVEIKFPLSGVEFQGYDIKGCFNLKRIYLPPNIKFYPQRFGYPSVCIFDEGNLEEIVLSKTFNKESFRNFILNIQKFFNKNCVDYELNKIPYEERRKYHNGYGYFGVGRKIKIIVRNLVFSKEEFYEVLKQNKNIYFEIDGIYVNDILVNFIFTDKIEEGYLDY